MAIQWDTSWGTSSLRNTVAGAVDRMEQILTKAYFSIKAVTRDDDQRQKYVDHFGDNALANLDFVTRAVVAMHDRLTDPQQVLNLAYVPDNDAFIALGKGPLPSGVVIEQVEAFVSDRGIATTAQMKIYIAPAFFSGDVYIPKTPTQRSGTGTILHEMAHGVAAEIIDHAYLWQPAYLTLSAADRATNADSYRAYLQSFDKLY